MFKSEAIWISRCFDKILEFVRGAPVRVLNLGSSTEIYRQVSQPYINEYIFEKYKGKCIFVHADFKDGHGIDIHGDFCDPHFWRNISDCEYDILLCSNLLTHVMDREIIIDNIRRIVKPLGYVIVTSPLVYPYCSDPYDSKFRPTPTELVSLFEGFELVEYSIVGDGDRHYDRLILNKKHLIALMANIILPMRGYQRWKNVVSDIPNVFRLLKTSCILIRKKPYTQSLNS